jgi:hypothetical protein
MVRRPLRPSFGLDDQDRLIKALGDARKLAGLYGAAAGFGTARYEKVRALGACIDDLALELTGDREFFHDKPHG